MKVVQINAVNRFSSTGTNTYELHKYLIEHGHESHVFCTNENNPDEGIFRIGNRLDYKLHALFSRAFGLQGYFSKSSTKALVKKLKSIKPDVVVLGNLHGNYINLEVLFSYLSRNNISVVNVLHDCWTFTGHCCHYTKIGCEKWMDHCHHCPLLREDNVSYIDRSTKIFREKLQMFHSLSSLGIVGVSNWIQEEAKKSPIFPSNAKFKTIYNWIDLNVFRPQDKMTSRAKLGLSPNHYYAISVSHQWSDAKGLSAIVKLATSMREVKFILIGENPAISNMPNNIIFPGVISDNEILSTYYSASNVYLNFSKQETFGKVSAEALACGLPILSSDTTASPEVAGVCGVSIDTINEERVLSTFKKFLSGEYSINQETCRQRAEALFSQDRSLDAYIKFFELILNNQQNESLI